MYKIIIGACRRKGPKMKNSLFKYTDATSLEEDEGNYWEHSLREHVEGRWAMLYPSRPYRSSPFAHPLRFSLFLSYIAPSLLLISSYPFYGHWSVPAAVLETFVILHQYHHMATTIKDLEMKQEPPYNHHAIVMMGDETKSAEEDQLPTAKILTRASSSFRVMTEK